MTAVWIPREGQPLVWDATINARFATIVGGVQKFEGKKTLEIETYACSIGDLAIGQRGTLEAAQEWCEKIVANMPEPKIAEMHLWRVMQYGVHRRVEGHVYGDRRFATGKKITTDNILTLDWHEDGDLVKTVDESHYRLCPPERTAVLIAFGYDLEMMDRDRVAETDG